MKLLLEYNSDPQAVDEWSELGPVGWATVVYWAPQFHRNRTATANYLLEQGARLDPFSATVLNAAEALRTMEANLAALEERLGFVRRHGQPLHMAAALGRVDLVSLLLDLGANPRALTGWGVSALGITIPTRQQAVVELLRQRGATMDISAALLSCADAGLTAAVHLLLERGANPDLHAVQLIGETPSTVTPRHLAAMKGHTEIARLLLTEGADRGLRDGQFHSTAAGFAQFAGHAELAALIA